MDPSIIGIIAFAGLLLASVTISLVAVLDAFIYPGADPADIQHKITLAAKGMIGGDAGTPWVAGTLSTTKGAT